MKRKKSRRLGLESLELRRLLAAVDIPDDLTGAAAAIVSVPVNVDDAAGIRGAEIRLSYNTNLSIARSFRKEGIFAWRFFVERG